MCISKPSALTQARVRELFEYRDGVLYWRVNRGARQLKGRRAGNLNSAGYWVVTADGQAYLQHRLIWLWHHGAMPATDVDHIDRDSTNNRIENLRVTTHALNLRNAGKIAGTRSRWKGVSWSKAAGRWRAALRVDGRSKYLGLFHDEEDAAQAFNFAAWHHFGEFAYLNCAEQTGLECLK